jgi:hypothetical protein
VALVQVLEQAQLLLLALERVVQAQAQVLADQVQARLSLVAIQAQVRPFLVVLFLAVQVERGVLKVLQQVLALWHLEPTQRLPQLKTQGP